MQAMSSNAAALADARSIGRMRLWPAAAATAGSVLAGPVALTYSHQHHVVVVEAVQRLDLQADRPADLRLELAQGRGLFVEQTIHDVLVGEYQQLAAGKLPALTHDLPKNLVANRLRGAHEATPLAAWTRLAQQVF